MEGDDDSLDLACVQCGLIFGWDDCDPDDAHCPECGGNNLIGTDEIGQ